MDAIVRAVDVPLHEAQRNLEKLCLWAGGLLILFGLFGLAEPVTRWLDWLALAAPIRVGWPVEALLVPTLPLSQNAVYPAHRPVFHAVVARL